MQWCRLDVLQRRSIGRLPSCVSSSRSSPTMSARTRASACVSLSIADHPFSVISIDGDRCATLN
jgi:hypothetical protein